MYTGEHIDSIPMPPPENKRGICNINMLTAPACRAAPAMNNQDAEYIVNLRPILSNRIGAQIAPLCKIDNQNKKDVKYAKKIEKRDDFGEGSALQTRQ